MLNRRNRKLSKLVDQNTISLRVVWIVRHTCHCCQRSNRARFRIRSMDSKYNKFANDSMETSGSPTAQPSRKKERKKKRRGMEGRLAGHKTSRRTSHIRCQCNSACDTRLLRNIASSSVEYPTSASGNILWRMIGSYNMYRYVRRQESGETRGSGIDAGGAGRLETGRRFTYNCW